MKTASRRIIDLTDDGISLAPEPIEQRNDNGSVHSPEAALDVASELHRARTRKRISLARASDETKIAKDYLQALENNGTIDRFPAPVYARFFLEDYARFLGIEPGPLLTSFDGHQPTLEPVIVEPIRERWGRTHKWTGRILVAASITAVAGMVVQHVVSENWSPVPRAASSLPDRSVVAAGSKLGHEAPSGSTATARPAIRGVHARLAVTAPCWIRASSDGTVVLQETVPAGRIVNFRAKRSVELILGNAGGASMRVNNRPVATGGPGEVVHIELLWQNGRVVTKR
jgi:Helix-turn-helix domain/RodZ C-terminal domain